jgi:hypothetical protein
MMIKETNVLRHERVRRLTQLGLLCQKMRVFKYRVPKGMIEELRSYSVSLTAMKEDSVLSDIAINRLEVVDTLLQYARVLNSGDRPTATALMKQAEAIWVRGDLIAERVVMENV